MEGSARVSTLPVVRCATERAHWTISRCQRADRKRTVRDQCTLADGGTSAHARTRPALCTDRLGALAAGAGRGLLGPRSSDRDGQRLSCRHVARLLHPLSRDAKLPRLCGCLGFGVLSALVKVTALAGFVVVVAGYTSYFL